MQRSINPLGDKFDLNVLLEDDLGVVNVVSEGV